MYFYALTIKTSVPVDDSNDDIDESKPRVEWLSTDVIERSFTWSGTIVLDRAQTRMSVYELLMRQACDAARFPFGKVSVTFFTLEPNTLEPSW